MSPRHFALLSVLLYSLNTSADEQATNTVAPGKVVAITYTATLSDGTVVHSNVGDRFPLKYKQGDGKLLPALDAALLGLAPGDRKTVTLTPEDAYGPVDEALFREVPIEQLPEDVRHVGAVISLQTHPSPIQVIEVGEDTVVLDFNSPYAGKTLTYDITIVGVQ